MKTGIRRTLKRGLCLRCPQCGKGRLFEKAFRMRPTCNHCGFRFEREPGYFIGAIYLNYAATITIALGTFLVLETWSPLDFGERLACAVACAAILPLLLHHHAKSLWLGFDSLISPDDRPPLRRVS